MNLIGLLPKDFFFSLRDQLNQMDIFYIPNRYPDALLGILNASLPGKEEADEAITLARSSLSHSFF